AAAEHRSVGSVRRARRRGGASAGAVDGGGDERADCGGVGAPGGGVRRMPLADRYAEEDGADLEKGDVCRWGGVGRWRTVSGGTGRRAERCFGMRTAGTLTAAAFLIFFLACAHCGVQAQETQAEPQPVTLAPAQTQQTGSQPTGTQKAAPVERRASKPAVNSTEPVVGPLTKTGTAGQAGAQPAGQSRIGEGPVGTIRVQTRLVNVALNVVDAQGSPVGGFEKKDFQLFEDGKPQTTAIFEREATSPLEIVLAIDASETVLTSDRLEKAAAQHFVRAILCPPDELHLVDFADTVREIVPFTNQAKRIEQGLSELQHGDETALYDAVYLPSDRLAQPT